MKTVITNKKGSELAKELSLPVSMGAFFGQFIIVVGEDEFPIYSELLAESKLPYEVKL